MKDDKEKNFVFSRIRKSEILRENKRRAKCTENPDFSRERQQEDTDLVICGTRILQQEKNVATQSKSLSQS